MIAKTFDGIVLTTHKKLTNSRSRRENGEPGDYFINKEYLIFDECPSDELIDAVEVNLSDIEQICMYLEALESESIGIELTINALKDVINQCKQLLYRFAEYKAKSSKERITEPIYDELEIGHFDEKALYAAINKLKDTISSKVLEVLNKSHVVYSGSKDKFSFGRLKPIAVSDKQVTILSATPHMPIIKACFGQDNVIHHQCNLTQQKGQLFWVYSKKTSKSGMRENPKSFGKLDREWSDRITEIPSHTLAVCKEFKNQVNSIKNQFSAVVLNYPCSGLNQVKGKSMTAIGKYLESEQSLLMKALLIGATPVTLARQNHKLATRDGLSYSTYTFEDDTLRQLDTVSYERAMLQTVGRARLLDNAATVFFISDRALPRSQKITYDDFIHKVHISVTDSSVTMSYRTTKEESNLLIDKYFGLRNEDGSLTKYGADLLKKFNNDHKTVIRYVTKVANNDIEGA